MRQREIAGDANERPHPHDSRLPTRLVAVSRMTWLLAWFRRRRQPVPCGAANLSPSRRRRRAARYGTCSGTVAKLVWPSSDENGAAHQGRAAQAGQDRAGKPLYRDAPAIDQAAALAIDRKRRLIAELDRRRLRPPGRMGAACRGRKRSSLGACGEARKALRVGLGPDSTIERANRARGMMPRRPRPGQDLGHIERL